MVFNNDKFSALMFDAVSMRFNKKKSKEQKSYDYAMQYFILELLYPGENELTIWFLQ